jgi:hypothetical protein
VVGRAAALLIGAGALVAWFEVAPHLSPVSKWPAVAIVTLAVMPAMFGLVWLALPLWRHPKELAVGVVVLLVATLVLAAVGAPVLANLAKFATISGAGLLFLSAFDQLSWAVTVALIIPFVDAFSVWRGPTHSITQNHPAVFTKLSVAFVTPGGGSARIGLPDILFFAVFLGASARFNLRPGWTWLAMTAGLGATLALTTVWSTSGLPALPAIGFGFLLANADLIWKQLASSRAERAAT